jgi:plastocyanin domain-containing protein
MRFSTAVTLVVSISCLAAAGGSLGGCGKKSEANADMGAPGDLRVTAGEHGFSPTSMMLPKGAAGSLATVTFVRTTDQTCATEVVFPDLDLKKALPLNTPVTVDVPSDAPRTLSFQCGMGMYKGALVVR